MKSIVMKSIYFKIIFASLILVGCAKNDQDDDQITVVNPPEQVDTEINDFIWTGLNQWYYWQEKVNNLADTKDDNAATYKTYLSSLDQGEPFFNSLKHEDDRFSWIEDDYTVLENQLAGISASNGMKFILYRRCDGCNGLVAGVTYVLPNSDAAEKGVVRGDIFNSVNGEELTLDNYSGLIYSDAMSYSIDLVNYNPSLDVVTPRNITITLNKEENFQEIPIHKNQVIEHNGVRVGYLMYNQFLSTVDADGDGQNEHDFNQALIDVFAELQSQNITELVVDLRYNGGGSVQTCTYLASLITGQFTGEIFAKQIWNSKLMAYIDSVNSNSDPDDDLDFNNHFVDQTTGGVNLPSLGLNRVYFLTSGRSASASELLINGLAAHIDVIQIGGTTYGKNVGSITLYDYIDNNNEVKNPNHRYAMQPIVLKIANNDGFADYADGLPPEPNNNPRLSFVSARESVSSFGVLGSPTEPFLAAALNQISPDANARKAAIPQGPVLESILDKETARQQRMFIELPKISATNLH